MDWISISGTKSRESHGNNSDDDWKGGSNKKKKKGTGKKYLVQVCATIQEQREQRNSYVCEIGDVGMFHDGWMGRMSCCSRARPSPSLHPARLEARSGPRALWERYDDQIK